ncbi:short-chain dehydrogenase/reductase SDR [Colletotrichum tofieldiae]|nr:short-chain dehydrogenase/reductase SDR [Colletotrichum tofieldiae]
MSDFTTEAFTLLGVAIGVIFLRTYARVKAVGIKHLQADDYLMLFVAVTYSAETALAYSVGAFWRGLANNGMTDEERRNLDPNSEEFMLRYVAQHHIGVEAPGNIGQSQRVKDPDRGMDYLQLPRALAAKAAMCTFYVRLTVSDTDLPPLRIQR